MGFSSLCALAVGLCSIQGYLWPQVPDPSKSRLASWMPQRTWLVSVLLPRSAGSGGAPPAVHVSLVHVHTRMCLAEARCSIPRGLEGDVHLHCLPDAVAPTR